MPKRKTSKDIATTLCGEEIGSTGAVIEIMTIGKLTGVAHDALLKGDEQSARVAIREWLTLHRKDCKDGKHRYESERSQACACGHQER